MFKIKHNFLVYIIIAIGFVAIVYIVYLLAQLIKMNSPISEQISVGSLLVSIVSTCTVILASIFAVQQLREATNSRKVTAYIAMADFLQKDEIRNCREIVYELADSGVIIPHENWTEEQKKAVQKVLYSFDLVGIMIENGLIEEHLTKSWDYAINKTNKITKEYLAHLRSNRGGKTFFSSLDYLFEISHKRCEK